MALLTVVGLALLRPPVQPFTLFGLLVSLLLVVTGAKATAGGIFSWGNAGFALLAVSGGWEWGVLGAALGLGCNILLSRAHPVGVLAPTLAVQLSFVAGASAQKLELSDGIQWFVVCIIQLLLLPELTNWMSNFLSPKLAERFRQEQRVMVLPRVGATVVGLALSMVEPQSFSILGLLGLALLQPILHRLWKVVDAEDRQILEHRLSGVAGSLSNTKDQLRDTRRTLKESNLRSELLEEFATVLLKKRSTPPKPIAATLEAAQKLAGSNTSAFFRKTEGLPELVQVQGPLVNLEDIKLAGLSEPVVVKAFETASPQLLSGAEGEAGFSGRF